MILYGSLFGVLTACVFYLNVVVWVWFLLRSISLALSFLTVCLILPALLLVLNMVLLITNTKIPVFVIMPPFRLRILWLDAEVIVNANRLPPPALLCEGKSLRCG